MAPFDIGYELLFLIHYLVPFPK